MSKLKILLVGPVEGNVKILADKLKSLSSSKAGPFDACFCVGPLLASSSSDNQNDNDADDSSKETNESIIQQLQDLPLPVYLQQDPGIFKAQTINQDDSDSNNKNNPIQLAPNLWLLASCGVDGTTINDQANLWEISIPNQDHPLIVASCPPHFRIDADHAKPLLDKTSLPSYVGCDLLLTQDWPQGMKDVLQVDSALASSSFDIAQVALHCRPRYHVAASTSIACKKNTGYHASPAYRIPNTPHLGRFLALNSVIATGIKATKTNKYIHALGLVPIQGDPPLPALTTPALSCPFVSKKNNTTTAAKNPAPTLSFAHAVAAPPSFSMFENKQRKRPRKDDDQDGGNNNNNNDSLEPPDDTISTLFLYGLHKDVTGELQSTSSPMLLHYFAKFGVQQVRHPPAAQTSTYCFLEFPSQAQALACLLECNGGGSSLVIKGVSLTLKWAATNNKNKRNRSEQDQQQRGHYVTQAEAANSTTLYFHPPVVAAAAAGDTTITSVEGGDEIDKTTSTPTNLDEESNTFSEELRQFMETTLEYSLNEGVEDPAERVTAETEPALSVQVRPLQKFGFLEFASHAAATMALAALTTSTDGGTLVPPPPASKEGVGAPKPPLHLVGTTLRWAKGEDKNKKRTKESDFLEALGLERKHFPADARKDCWFCLASSTCEKHLIAGVYETCYATMPKGPMHPGHVLLVPVTHSSQGAWTMGNQGANEMLQLKELVRRHASEVYEMDLFLFERAIETKGGYHTHVQCVPIPRGNSTKLQAVMMAHAKASGFDLRQVQSDLGMTSVMTEDDNYFYAEIATDSQVYRYVYKASAEASAGRTSGGGRRDGPKVPLQFGREVLASVLNQPELAHWKSCVVDKEKETELAATFRDTFSKFLK
jgi:diadenosine tetraphosphate (Ap4A) HIT family hydrolase